jgi:hypothetical protein
VEPKITNMPDTAFRLLDGTTRRGAARLYEYPVTVAGLLHESITCNFWFGYIDLVGDPTKDKGLLTCMAPVEGTVAIFPDGRVGNVRVYVGLNDVWMAEDGGEHNHVFFVGLSPLRRPGEPGYPSAFLDQQKEE